jgi:phage terminase large subunit
MLNPARYKALFGGRGSGKSHFFGEALIERCLMEPTRAVCVREVQKSLGQSVKQLLSDKIDRLGVRNLFHETENQIEAPGSGLITFQGMQNHTAESIKSLEGYDIAWVEEAQSLSERSLRLLRPTIRKPGSELWFSWNPNSEADPVDALLRGPQPPPRTVLVEANWNNNPWFPAELREEMEYDRRRDPDKYAHVWGGGYLKRSEARVFQNWRIDTLDIPKDARPYFGADWGFSVDPTVLVRVWVWGRTMYVDREVYKVGCEIDRTPELFNKINDEIVPAVGKWPITADSARPETIAYMRSHGFPSIASARKGPGSVEEGVEFLKNFDIVVSPACRHTSDELTAYSWKVDKKTEEVLPELEDKDNHVIDALRYAVEGLRRAPPKPLFGSYGR